MTGQPLSRWGHVSRLDGNHVGLSHFPGVVDCAVRPKLCGAKPGPGHFRRHQELGVSKVGAVCVHSKNAIVGAVAGSVAEVVPAAAGAPMQPLRSCQNVPDVQRHRSLPQDHNAHRFERQPLKAVVVGRVVELCGCSCNLGGLRGPLRAGETAQPMHVGNEPFPFAGREEAGLIEQPGVWFAEGHRV